MLISDKLGIHQNIAASFKVFPVGARTCKVVEEFLYERNDGRVEGRIQ